MNIILRSPNIELDYLGIYWHNFIYLQYVKQKPLTIIIVFIFY